MDLRRILRGLLVLGAVGLLMGCVGKSDAGAGDANGEGGVAGAAPRGVVVARDNPNLPPGCRPRRIGRLAQTFSAALSRGDQATLARLWGGRFEWFSITADPAARSVGPLIGPQRDRRGFTAYSRDDALRYVGHPRGFEVRLSELAINGGARGGGVDVSYAGVWHERTGAKVRKYGLELEGKGFVNCGRRRDGQSIRVWSMGVQGSPGRSPRFCPGRGGARGSLVVCWLPE